MIRRSSLTWRVCLSVALLAHLGAAIVRADDDASFLSKARQFISEGKLRDAEACLLAKISTNTEAVDAHYLLGYVYFRERKPKESLAEYTLGATGRRPTATEFDIIGADYVLLKSLPDADRWFTEATKDAPADADGWYLLGRTKYGEGNYSGAVDAFQHSLAIRARDVKAEDNLGLSYQALNRIAEATAAFETAISWERGLPNASGAPYLDLGELLIDENQAVAAIAPLRQAVALSPGNPKAHEQLGRAYQQIGDFASARTELESTTALAPESSGAHFRLGQIYRRLGRQELARKEFDITEHLSSTHASTETPNFDRTREGDEKLAAPSVPSLNGPRK